MGIITNNEKLNAIKQSLYNYYIYNVSDISFLNLENIYFVEDLSTDHKLFELELRDMLVGITICNPDKNVPIEIIIDTKDASPHDISVRLAHEFTHAYDEEKFRKAHNLLTDQFLNTFLMWTEFHAHCLGEIVGTSYMNRIFNRQIQEMVHHFDYPSMVQGYVDKFYNDLLVRGFQYGNLMSLLSKFYVLDWYQNLDYNHSCFHQYKHNFVPDAEMSHIDSIYKICYHSMSNCQDESFLKELYQILQ